MTTDTDSIGLQAHQADQRAMNDTESWACYLLATAGWSVGELAMTFQCGERAVRSEIKRHDEDYFARQA